MTRADRYPEPDDDSNFAFDDRALDLDDLLSEVVGCCRDLATIRLDHVGERELMVALCHMMSIEVMLEGVQCRLGERIDGYLADRYA